MKGRILTTIRFDTSSITDKIMGCGNEDLADATFHLISRNATLGHYGATDEELLLETVNEVKRSFLKDLKDVDTRVDEDVEDIEELYPLFTAAMKEKATQFSQNTSGYRQLCCLHTFMLGLVMASRVRSHYAHAKWFKIATLRKMMDIHGTVS